MFIAPGLCFRSFSECVKSQQAHEAINQQALCYWGYSPVLDIIWILWAYLMHSALFKWPQTRQRDRPRGPLTGCVSTEWILLGQRITSNNPIWPTNERNRPYDILCQLWSHVNVKTMQFSTVVKNNHAQKPTISL